MPSRWKEVFFVDDLGQLKKELEEQTRLAEERLERLRYLQADFDNYRKWYEKEKEVVISLANENLIRDLLVILDDLERALPAIEREKDREGIGMVYKKMRKILGTYGLAPIECMGKRFDPRLHEALCKEQCGAEPGTVLEDIQKGYQLNEKVIRPSRVKIAEPVQDQGKEGEAHG